jgi:transcription antitermination protein NusB
VIRPVGSSGQPSRSGLGGRAAARLAAVQALYQMKMTGEGASSVIDDFMTHHLAGPDSDPEVPGLGKADRDFFRDLVEGVASEADSLDDMLTAVLAEDWPVERLESVLGLILRAGAYELGHRPEVPPRVVVSQYVDLAHAFLDDKQTAMVNGVLDRLARHLRPEEFAGEALPDLAG